METVSPKIVIEDFSGTIARRPKFWSDDFDMDLLKVFPQLGQVFDAVTKTPVYTHGGTSHDRLNHPSVWNAPDGLIAFFSFSKAVTNKPAYYWTREPVVECTWDEVMRDAWPHHYTLRLEGRAIFHGALLMEQFQTIMYDLRGWDKAQTLKLRAARAKVEDAILCATERFESLAKEYGNPRT